MVESNKLIKMIEDFKSKLMGRNVYFLWSGGDDSNLILRLLRYYEFNSICNLNVIAIPFPQHVYAEEKVKTALDTFSKQNISFQLLNTKETIDDNVPYAKSCLLCKEIRRNKFLEYYLPIQKENDLIITGHNLSDLMSYYIELCIMKLHLDQPKNYDNRLLEVTNKWLKSYITSEGIEIYRPFLDFSQVEIAELLDDSELKEYDIPIIGKKCYWSNQRKRLIQEYIVKANLVSNYEKCESLLKTNFKMPELKEFWSLPFDTYLM